MTVPLNTQTDPVITRGMSLKDVRTRAAAWLKERDIETPDIDARFLVMEAMGLNRTELLANSGEMIAPDTAQVLESFLKRRASGEPIDSILGHQDFYGRRFRISKDVLSPRPETEDVANLAVEFLKTVDKPNILDLGTGSGAILISILAERDDATGIGADVSEAALDVARTNAKQLGVTDRSEWVLSDWYSNIQGQFDLIVSNPPYITNTAMRALTPEVANYDPDLALRGGEDGLDAYRAILARAMDYLRPRGVLIVEIGYDQGDSVPRLFAEHGFEAVNLTQDLSGHDRIVSGVLPDN